MEAVESPRPKNSTARIAVPMGNSRQVKKVERA
jgi:hypothetical protein